MQDIKDIDYNNLSEINNEDLIKLFQENTIIWACTCKDKYENRLNKIKEEIFRRMKGEIK